MDQLQSFFDNDGQLQADSLRYRDRELPDTLATDQYALNIALNYAATWNHVDVMQFLVERGAQVNAQPPGYYWPKDPGASALHRAANAGRMEAVRWLLAHGAEPTLREPRWDDLASGWSRYRGFTEVEALLIDAAEKWPKFDADD